MNFRKALYQVIKRICDLVTVIAMAPLWLPLLLISSLLVRIRLGSPVLFRQRRVGKGNRVFTILKLRTMVDGEGSDEERITPLGIFLRKTSLDELPQVINVLRGEMSIVGPRPLLEEYLPRYNEEQARRHNVRPGITGWAQVNGRNAITWEERFKLDIWYVDNASIWLDLKIVLKTFASVINGKGATTEDGKTMAKFNQ